MKNLSFSSLFLFLLIICSCHGEKYIKKEKEAIQKVIEESTDAYKARDFDRLSKIYIHDESVTRLNAGKDGFTFRNGWDKIGTVYKELFETNPDAITNKYEKMNFKIRVYKKSAWAIHDENILDSENEYMYHQIGVHFLEKVDGEWKIVYLSYVDTSSYKET